MSDRTLLEKVAHELTNSEEEVGLSDLTRDAGASLAWSGIAAGLFDKTAHVKIAKYWRNLLRTDVRAAKGELAAVREKAEATAAAEEKKIKGRWWRTKGRGEAVYAKKLEAGQLKETNKAIKEIEEAQAALKKARGEANVALAGTAAAAGAGGLGVAGGRAAVRAHKRRKAEEYGEYS